jgi:hypothetical protein
MRFGRDLAVPALAVLIGCNAATSSNEQRLANDGPRATNPATIAAEVAEAPASLEQPPSVEVDVFGTVITSKRLDEAYGLLVWEQIQRDQDEMSDMGRRLAMVRERMSQDAVVRNRSADDHCRQDGGGGIVHRWASAHVGDGAEMLGLRR